MVFPALTILIAIITDAYVEAVDIEKDNPSVGVVSLMYKWVMGLCRQTLRVEEAAVPAEPEPTLKDLMAKIVGLEERLVQAGAVSAPAGAVSAPAPAEDNQTEAAGQQLIPKPDLPYSSV